ncbi:MAG TPA: hypothetical protein VLY46_05795 [Usitatibacter sp.]|nr:hypothetical protein [Usitatibacter sp.]
MRKLVTAVFIALAGVVSVPASAQISFGFSSGGVHLGINIPVYPRLVPIPGYPVYYAPNLDQNYFFYDGFYWLFYNDSWYQSQWYNGPWTLVPPDYVPPYILRVPVRYYHHRPAYFHGWALNAPPHWDQHYGHAWSESHRDWNHWDRHSVPQRAPLPSYQRNYAGNHYPSPERQQQEHARNYHYTPHGNYDYAQRQEHTDRLMKRETSPNRVPAGHENPKTGVSREEAARHQEHVESKTGQQWHGNQPDPRRGSGPADTGGG